MFVISCSSCVSNSVKVEDKPTRSAADNNRVLTGKWRVLSFKINGQQMPVDVINKMEWRFKGKVAVYLDQEKAGYMFSYHLDPRKSPPTIDLTALDGKLKGQTIPGIYKQEKSRLMLCVRLKEAMDLGRPMQFKSTPANGLMVLEAVAGN